MELQKPLVSIITPTYNHEKYIDECIQSVIAQTWQNWEMIIIDDGSTDKTANIVQKHAINDSRIVFISQNNVGIFNLAETYNKALKLSKGEYIAILEGDDYWEPQKLEWQIDVMKNDSSVVLCWGKATSRVGHQKEVYQVHPVSIERNLKYYFNEPIGSFFNAVFDDFFPPLTFIIRKDALAEIGGFIQKLPFPAVDLSTILALSKIGKFYFFDKILGTWRISPNQTTKTLNNDILEGGNVIIVNHYKSLDQTERKRIEFDEENIWERYHKRKIITLTRSGRFRLIRRDFKGARKDYIKALGYYGFAEPVWKLRALAGLIFSFLHLDVEILAKWFGKGSLK